MARSALPIGLVFLVGTLALYGYGLATDQLEPRPLWVLVGIVQLLTALTVVGMGWEARRNR